MDIQYRKQQCLIYIVRCESGEESCKLRTKKFSDFRRQILSSGKELFGLKISPKYKAADILKELETNEYIQYASIAIVFAYYCSCEREAVLLRIREALLNNSYVRYLTKFLLITKPITFEEATRPDEDFTEDLSQVPSAYPYFECLGCSSAEYPDVDNLVVIEMPVYQYYDNLLDDAPIIHLHTLLKSNTRDHCVQSFVKKGKKFVILRVLRVDGVLNFSQDSYLFRAYYASAEGNYFYAVNPALAITINSAIDRPGNEHDVKNIKRVCAIHNIPLISLPKSNILQVVQTLNAVERYDFGGLSNLLLFISSHGEEGDIILTEGGQYSLRDIIKPLASNQSLHNTEIFIFVSACRGELVLNPKKARGKPMNELSSRFTTKQDLPNNIHIMFSTAKYYASGRSAKSGTWFISEVTKEWSNGSKVLDVNTFMEKCRSDFRQPELLTNKDEIQIVDTLENLFKLEGFFKNWQQFCKSKSQAGFKNNIGQASTSPK